MMRSLLIGLGCFAIGIAVGVWAPNRTGDLVSVDALEGDGIASGRDGLTPADPAGHPSPGAGGDFPVQSPGETASDGGKASRSVVVSTSFIQALSQGQGKRNWGQAILDPEGTLEKALELSDEERLQISNQWGQLKQKVRALEAGSTTVEELEDASVRIVVPDLSDQLIPLGSEFGQSVQQVLGQNRGDVFLAAKQIDQLLQNTGGERTYTIQAEPVGEEDWRFKMTVDSEDGQRVWVGNSIPSEIRHLTDTARIAPNIHSLPE